eukprot:3401959-Pyramimonas_sp.AAC.1
MGGMFSSSPLLWRLARVSFLGGLCRVPLWVSRVLARSWFWRSFLALCPTMASESPSRVLLGIRKALVFLSRRRRFLILPQGHPGQRQLLSARSLRRSSSKRVSSSD